MEGRTGKQIRDRYLNKLRPNIKCGDWSPAEDAKLVSLCKEIGHRWSAIATYLPGRTEAQVKNRFYSHIKKRANSGDDSQASISRTGSEESGSASPSTDGEEIVYDFGLEVNNNMFGSQEKNVNLKKEEQYRVQYIREEESLSEGSTAYTNSPFLAGQADPTDVISYETPFLTFKEEKSTFPTYIESEQHFPYGLSPVRNENDIDDMLNRVANYFEGPESIQVPSNVDSFFDMGLKSVEPTIVIPTSSDDNERYAQLKQRKAYLEFALARTMSEINKI